MNAPKQISLSQWDNHYKHLQQQGLSERFFGGPLSRHVTDGDTRLLHLRLDNSPAALSLWNLLLSENDRLRLYRKQGKKIIGTMKDLGTIPVMVFSFENLVAFYPDGTWWTPCIMEQNEGLFELAEKYGLDESYCPVRAMFAAFINEEHFPKPDLLISSTGAVCDDFSAIAQRLEQVGFKMHWWEIPHRRTPYENEPTIQLPTGTVSPQSQVDFVQQELKTIRNLLENTAGTPLTDSMLSDGIQKSNQFRKILNKIRQLAYTAEIAPMGSLEMLVTEMLALHYCSDYNESLIVLNNLLKEIQVRVGNNVGVLPKDAARIFWVNPVADIKVMNVLEACGGRVCGTEYLFSHALDIIPESIEPFEALAKTALGDLMVGSITERTQRIQQDMKRFGAEGVIISRIPGASHCAWEGMLIANELRQSTHLPVIEIEVPSLCEASEPSIQTRLEALVETIKQRRQL